MNFLKLKPKDFYKDYKEFVYYVNTCYLECKTKSDLSYNLAQASRKGIKFYSMYEKFNDVYTKYLLKIRTAIEDYNSYEEACANKKFSQLVYEEGILSDLNNIFKYFDKCYQAYFAFLFQDIGAETEFDSSNFVRIHSQTVVDMFKEIKEKELEVTEQDYLINLRAKADDRLGSMLVLNEEEVMSLKLWNKILGEKYNFVIWELYNYKCITFADGKGEDVFKEITKTL